jgi:hypothetical protein
VTPAAARTAARALAIAALVAAGCAASRGGPAVQGVPAPMVANCLRVVSQNALHFGWNDPGPMAQKIPPLVGMFGRNNNAATGLNLIVLIQEVMKNVAGYNPFTATYPNYITSVGSGPPGYVEHYGFVPDTAFFVPNAPRRFVNGTYDYRNINAGQAMLFIRPPSGVFVSCGNGTQPAQNVWLLNFHAIFGKRKGQRTAEAAALAQAVRDYLGCQVNQAAPGTCVTAGWQASALIIGGDWNIPGQDVNAHLCGSPNLPAGYACTVHINVKTSINRPGNFTSQYDHFVSIYPTGTADPLGAAAIIAFPEYTGITCMGTPCLQFRRTVSDHIGIKTNVSR